MRSALNISGLKCKIIIRGFTYRLYLYISKPTKLKNTTAANRTGSTTVITRLISSSLSLQHSVIAVVVEAEKDDNLIVFCFFCSKCFKPRTFYDRNVNFPVIFFTVLVSFLNKSFQVIS